MYDPLMEYKEEAADDEVLQQMEGDRQQRISSEQAMNEQIW